MIWRLPGTRWNEGAVGGDSRFSGGLKRSLHLIGKSLIGSSPPSNASSASKKSNPQPQTECRKFCQASGSVLEGTSSSSLSFLFPCRKNAFDPFLLVGSGVGEGLEGLGGGVIGRFARRCGGVEGWHDRGRRDMEEEECGGRGSTEEETTQHLYERQRLVANRPPMSRTFSGFGWERFILGRTSNVELFANSTN